MEDELLVEPVDAPEILDDFEFEEADNLDIQDREVNKQKLRRRIEQYKVDVRLLFQIFPFINSLNSGTKVSTFG